MLRHATWRDLSNLHRALMPSLTEALNSRWNSIPTGTRLDTPSGISHFTVTSIHPDEIWIHTRGGTKMKLRRAAFAAALCHLQAFDQPRLIGSNKDRRLAGDFCEVVRSANIRGGTMVITYVLPILQRMGLVEINSDIPNTAWLTSLAPRSSAC